MTATLDGVTKKKAGDQTGEQLAAVELVRLGGRPGPHVVPIKRCVTSGEPVDLRILQSLEVIVHHGHGQGTRRITRPVNTG